MSVKRNVKGSVRPVNGMITTAVCFLAVITVCLFANFSRAATIPNSAPVLDTSYNPSLPNIPKNIPSAANIGDTVRNIIADGSITDPDVSPAPEAIAVTGVDDTNGRWQYWKSSGSYWSPINDGVLSDDHALLLAADDRVRFQPNINWSGVSSLTFRAWDKTMGSVAIYADADPNGGGTAFSAEADTMAIAVVPDEPLTQASAVNFTTVLPTGMTVNWTNGDGDGRIVLVRSGGAVNADPADASVYTADAVFGNGSEIGTGNYVVYANNGSSITLTGLIPGITYYVGVYEYNGTGGAQNYLVPPATGSQATTCPEMDLIESANPVASGDTYDFGSTMVGGTIGPVMFTIENNGTGILNLTGTPKVLIGGADPGAFTIDETATTSPVAVSGATTYTIAFTPSSAGMKTAAIAIANDDPDENPYTVNLQGTGLSDIDGDGVPDNSDGCPNDPGKFTPGVCGCGVADTDADGDGTPDCNDGCPNDAGKVSPGMCGCGVADTDADGDGTADCNDACSNDPNKIVPGICGCGVSDIDTDADGIPDCIDDMPNGVWDDYDDDDAPFCDFIPAAVFPVDGAIDTSLTPTFDIDWDIDPDTCGDHHKTRWQISERPDFYGLAYNKNTIGEDPFNHEMPPGVLKPDTTYYWRARVWCSRGCKSRYSDTVSFTTAPDPNYDGQPGNHSRGVYTVVGNQYVSIETSENITFLQSLDNNDQAILDGMPDNMPWGLINFRIEIATPGDTVQVTIYFEKKARNDSVFYKYDPADGWIDYSDHATFSPDMKSVTIEIQDGGFGDLDGTANGVIVDPCGIGNFASGGGGGGCFLDTTGLHRQYIH